MSARVALDVDFVADFEVGSFGGVFQVAGEPEEAVGVGEGDPVAAFYGGKIAAKQHAPRCGMSGELEPLVACNAGAREVVGLGVHRDVAVHGGDFDDASGEAAAVGVEDDLGGLRRGLVSASK